MNDLKILAFAWKIQNEYEYIPEIDEIEKVVEYFGEDIRELAEETLSKYGGYDMETIVEIIFKLF